MMTVTVPEKTTVVPFSMRDAPSLIERAWPTAKISAETQKERKAGPGQTLTSLGSYWKGRKPLILTRACVLAALMPATEDLERDVDRGAAAGEGERQGEGEEVGAAGAGVVGEAEAGGDRGGVDADDAEGLALAGGAADEDDLAAGEAQEIGEEIDEGFVGGAVDRRGGELDAEAIAVDADDAAPGGAGDHLHVDLDARARPRADEARWHAGAIAGARGRDHPRSGSLRPPRRRGSGGRRGGG